MSEQDSKRATLSVKKRTVATPSARDEKPRLRAGARGRQVAQHRLPRFLPLEPKPLRRPTPPLHQKRARREAAAPKPCRKLAINGRLKKKYSFRKSMYLYLKTMGLKPFISLRRVRWDWKKHLPQSSVRWAMKGCLPRELAVIL